MGEKEGEGEGGGGRERKSITKADSCFDRVTQAL